LSHAPEFFTVPVAGGDLAVARWGTGPRVVLAAHGITASSISWAAVADQLEGDWTLLVPDLRGRGASNGLPGPYGMAVHARDMAAVAQRVGCARVVVAGHSMGGFVAVVLAGSYPELVTDLVLVDGGLPLGIPFDGTDSDAILDALLGPSIARLRQVFPTVDAYLAAMRAHPALVDDWNPYLDAYFRYDLWGDEPAMRSRVSEQAVRADGHDELVNEQDLELALRNIRCPVRLLRAPRGLLNQTPGIQPAELVQRWQVEVPQLEDKLVNDTNHYTILFGPRGARAVAAGIMSCAGARPAPMTDG
jgi:lipase